MCLIVRCPACGRKVRFKGKSSQISRGKDFSCPYCRGVIAMAKKPNGKLCVGRK